MTNCVVKRCPNCTEKHKKASKITFHQIPSDPNIAARWIENIRLNRKEICWKPTKSTRICSVHFLEKEKYITKCGLCKIHKNAVPTMGLHIHCTEANSSINDNSIHCAEANSTTSDNSNDPVELNQSEEGTLCNEAIDKVVENETSTMTPCRPITISKEAQALLMIHDSSADDDSMPRMASLRRQLDKKRLLQRKNRRTIQTLQQNTRRLKTKNLALQKIISKLLRILKRTKILT